LIIDNIYFNLNIEIQEYILKWKRTTIANNDLQEIKLQNKSKSLYIIDSISYYTCTSLIFYNNKSKVISNIVIKDARSIKLKQELNIIDNKFKT